MKAGRNAYFNDQITAEVYLITVIELHMNFIERQTVVVAKFKFKFKFSNIICDRHATLLTALFGARYFKPVVRVFFPFLFRFSFLRGKRTASHRKLRACGVRIYMVQTRQAQCRVGVDLSPWLDLLVINVMIRLRVGSFIYLLQRKRETCAHEILAYFCFSQSTASRALRI